MVLKLCILRHQGAVNGLRIILNIGVSCLCLSNAGITGIAPSVFAVFSEHKWQLGQHLGILTGSPESPVFPRLRKATISKQTKNEEVARGRMPSCCKLAVFTIPCLCPCDCCYLEHPSFPSLPGRLPHSPRCSPAGGFFMKPTSSVGSDASSSSPPTIPCLSSCLYRACSFLDCGQGLLAWC